jgi:Uma2 family endonuclease
MSREPETIEIPEIVLDFSALDRLPTDRDLPSDDGEPLETIWHRDAMNLLIDSIESHWRGRKDFFVGGNMFIYFSDERVFNKDFRGPDFFVVKNTDHDKKRDSWVYWKEGGSHPHVIIELSSPSTARIDRIEKLEVYAEKMRVPEYFIYEPRADSLEGWKLVDGAYEPLSVQTESRVWSQQLELFIGARDGRFLGKQGRWLRFFDKRGKLVPTFAEAAEAELARVKRELAALRKKRKK